MWLRNENFSPETRHSNYFIALRSLVKYEGKRKKKFEDFHGKIKSSLRAFALKTYGPIWNLKHGELFIFFSFEIESVNSILKWNKVENENFLILKHF